MTATIQSLATANPPLYVTGPEALRFFTDHFQLTDSERRLYERLLLEGPIRGRYLGLERIEHARRMTADQQTDRFQHFAISLAARAAKDALDAAGLAPADVDALVVNTCTGYLCPGLSSYLAEELALRPWVHPLDLMGMGCGAAIPNLQSASALLALAGPGVPDVPGRNVLSVAVEVCSATIFMGPDPGLVVSNCLFGDGAAAAVLASGSPARPGLVRLVDFESALLPRHRQALRYRHQDGRLRNVLGKRVPRIGARAVRQVVDRLLARHDLTRSAIDWWIVHPGGTAVLEQVARELGLSPESLRFSHEILTEYGNMSSPSVLFVLRRLLDSASPRPGQKGLLLSFGAGFSAHASLLEF